MSWDSLNHEQLAAESEYVELRRKIVVHGQNPETVANEYEGLLRSKNIERQAHWEALRRLRDEMIKDRQNAELIKLSRDNYYTLKHATRVALISAIAAIVAAVSSFISLFY